MANLTSIANTDRNNLLNLNTYSVTNPYNIVSDYGSLSTNPSDVLDAILQGDTTFSNINTLPSTDNSQLSKNARLQLTKAFESNSLSHLGTQTIGKINTDPISLLNGGNIWFNNHDITVPQGSFGKIGNFIAKVLGVESPTSLLSDSSWKYTPTLASGDKTEIDYLSLNNNLIANTGKGQVNSLFENLRQNVYQPGYKDNRMLGLVSDGLNANLYEDGNLSLAESVTNDSIDETNPVNTYSDTVTLTNDFSTKSILYKTAQMFADKGRNLTMIDAESMQVLPSQIQTATVNGFLSKGSAISTKDGQSNNRIFCRVWTRGNPYSIVNDMQKHRGIDPNGGRRVNSSKSVLEDNGFVKIAPYKSDIKKYMFAIENLAWSDYIINLPTQEVGPGDLLTGRQGRIMWFAPYDITFNHQSAGSWESTNFIGRSEPIYTYSNTERTGSLSFKIIVDHPTWLNYTNLNDDDILSVTAGCDNIPDIITNPDTLSSIVSSNNITNASSNSSTPPTFINAYFSNGDTTIDSCYESSSNSCNGAYIYGTNQELNENYFNFLDNPDTVFNKYNPLKITITSNSCENIVSTDTNVEETLYNLREARNAYIYGIINNLTKENDPLPIIIQQDGEDTGNGETLYPNDTDSKQKRVTTIKLEYSPLNNPNLPTPSPSSIVAQQPTAKLYLSQKFVDESDYFQKLKQTDPLAFDKIQQKVKYFHPAFHSTTPEGLNQRITFLEQCLRQGPTDNTLNQPTNLAFGRPPICILRLGDFFYTKIIIDNASYNYEPLLWDLNPEGIGLQPMLVQVTLSIKIIGGQSLDGPINQLQNAVSFNFFANNEMYSERPDTINVSTTSTGKLNGNINYGFSNTQESNHDIN